MAKFEIDFQIQGVGEAMLPVTALDDAIVLVNSLEMKLFRFSVQNTLGRAISLALVVDKVGAAADKVSVTVDVPVLALELGESAVVTTTIEAVTAMMEGDLVAVKIVGTEVV